MQSYLLEPFGRNTAPAVALAAHAIRARFGEDAVCWCWPPTISSATRPRSPLRSRARRSSRAKASSSRSASRPRFPRRDSATWSAASRSGRRAFAAVGFVEKPPLATARDFVAGRNARVELGHVRIHAAHVPRGCERYAPAVAAAARAAWQPLSARANDAMLEIDAATFASAPDLSIDYAVMEKAAQDGRVAVVRGEFDWSDVGSWQAVSELTDADADGNRGRGERVAIATRGTFIHSEHRVVATIGIENLVIVDTPDAVLVAHRDHLQRVKEVVVELKARGHDSYKLHKTVARPWGTYTVLEEGPGFKIKRIEVKPGGSLSLQLHHRRSEHWVVLRGTARVTSAKASSTCLTANRRSSRSRPCTASKIRGTDVLAIIEVACGDYIEEDDIVRFDDKYGRVTSGT